MALFTKQHALGDSRSASEVCLFPGSFCCVMLGDFLASLGFGLIIGHLRLLDM